MPPNSLPATTPTPATTTTTTNDIDRITSTLALCDGNFALAAEQLGLPDYEIMLTLSNNPQAQTALLKHMRAKLLTDAFTRIQSISNLIEDDLTSPTSPFRPSDKLEALRTYSTLFTELAKAGFAPDPTLNSANIFDKVMGALPPDAREAIAILATRSGPPTTDALQTAPNATAPANDGRLRRIRAESDREGDLD